MSRKTCSTCGGSGLINFRANPSGMAGGADTCTSCGGSGYVYGDGDGGSGSGQAGPSRGVPFKFEYVIGLLLVVAIWWGVTKIGLAVLDVNPWWSIGIGLGVALLAGKLLNGPFYFVLRWLKWGVFAGFAVYALIQYRESQVDYGAKGFIDIVETSFADAFYNDLPRVKAAFSRSTVVQGASSSPPTEVIVCRIRALYKGMQRAEPQKDIGTKAHYEKSVKYARQQFGDPNSSWRMQVDGKFHAKAGSFGFPVVVMKPRPSGGAPSVEFHASLEEQECPHEYVEWERFPLPETVSR